MITVTLTKGLPASGKTTWAKKMIEDNPGMYKRVNKDDLRAMLDGGRWSKDNEKMILKIRDTLILQAVEAGKHVIVDDTNLHHKHEDQIKQLVKGKAEVFIQDFTDVSLEECIKRDRLRTNSIGEKTIKQMHKQFLAPKPEVTTYNPKLPDCIVCDLDGTLALFGDRNPYERDFTIDEVNHTIKDILTACSPLGKVIFLSGRMDKFRTQTEEWLHKNWGNNHELFMRKTDDVRKDTIIKQEIYRNEIKDKYNVLFVLDDRNQVVEMWRQQGLICLQVAEGDF